MNQQAYLATKLPQLGPCRKYKFPITENVNLINTEVVYLH